MRSLVFFFVIFFVTVTTLYANAGFFLESHYGRVKQTGMKVTCTLRNNVKSTLDFKYVGFLVEPPHHRGSGERVQIRIDRRIHPGELVTASTKTELGAFVRACYFLAR